MYYIFRHFCLIPIYCLHLTLAITKKINCKQFVGKIYLMIEQCNDSHISITDLQLRLKKKYANGDAYFSCHIGKM